MERHELAVSERCPWCRVVVSHDLLERRDLAGVHVGRAIRHVAERRRLVGAHQLRAVRRGEPKLGAVVRRRVAVPAGAGELAGERLAHAHSTSAVRRRHRRSDGDARVVEVVVGEEGAVVAVGAVRLPDEQAEPRLLLGGERARRRVRSSGELVGHPAVEARRSVADAPFVGGDRLADVRVDPGDVVTPDGRKPQPRRASTGIGHRAGALWQPVQIGQRTEDRLVVGPVVRGDHLRVLRARAAVLHRALQRPERLRPLAVGAAVPEEPGGVRGPGHGHRAPAGGAHAVPEWRAVLELAGRLVAGRAGHTAVAAQPRVEEELAPQAGGSRVVRMTVGGIGTERVETGEGERRQQLSLFRRPARRTCAGGAGEQQPHRAGEQSDEHGGARACGGSRDHGRVRPKQGEAAHGSGGDGVVRAPASVVPAGGAAAPGQSLRLNTTESRPGAASMPNFTTHQPPMLNFIPSTT